MKGTFFVGADQPQKFEVREMNFAPLKPHEVLVKNMSAGICGTDVHIYHGEKGSAEVARRWSLDMNTPGSWWRQEKR